jgi:UDP-N-acetylmuramoyl-L-alanyl-D-glutamate--2,6-diaminopimelate ligase
MLVRADLRHPLSLRNVLPDAEFLGADDIAMTACSFDSRRVRPGTVFVVLPSPEGDERAGVSEAIARGCSGIVAQHEVFGSGVPICHVPHAGEAYGRICQALAGDPSRQLKVVGLSGTSGTTTTSCLVASILAAAGCKVGILGSLGYLDGRKVTHHVHTTPPAHDLARWLARMVGHGCTHAIVEVSNRALAERWIGGVAMDAVCVTNARHSQLADGRLGRECRPAESRLFEYLTAEGFAVVNADDPVALNYLQIHDGPVLTVGIESEAEITATFVDRCASEQTILLSAGSEVVPVRTRMIGIQHAYNCLTAAAVGLAYGIDLPAVVRGLEAIDYVPGRLERIECGQPFGVFVDCARTPEALGACLETLREVVRGRLICVFGAAGKRDKSRRPLLGRAVETRADLAVITDDNPHGEDPQVIIEDVLSGLKCPAEAEVIPDRAEAIGWALAQARPGDCVLIAGKGHRTNQVVGSQRHDFDDRQIARQWLYANPSDETMAVREHG